MESFVQDSKGLTGYRQEHLRKDRCGRPPAPQGWGSDPRVMVAELCNSADGRDICRVTSSQRWSTVSGQHPQVQVAMNCGEVTLPALGSWKLFGMLVG
jgi:hypothetical protein